MTSLALAVVGFFAAMGLHWWWTTNFAFFGIAPQVLLVLTVATAARRGSARAMTYGFVWGLFLDLMTPRLFGANALALTLVGYATGSIRRQVDVTGVAPQCLVVFGMTWAYFLFLGALGLVFLPPNQKQFLFVGWGPFLVDPIYNCFVGLIVSLFSEMFRERRR